MVDGSLGCLGFQRASCQRDSMGRKSLRGLVSGIMWLFEGTNFFCCSVVLLERS